MAVVYQRVMAAVHESRAGVARRASGSLHALAVGVALAALAAAAPGHAGAPAEPDPAAGRFVQKGMASWYGPDFAGRRTSSGARFDPAEMTAAHRTLPLGTRLLVTSRATGRSVVVTVNDRGPYLHSRIIDLSRAAALRLGMVHAGVGSVVLKRIVRPDDVEVAQAADTAR